jgi:hypothetical protein
MVSSSSGLFTQAREPQENAIRRKNEKGANGGD